MTCILYTNVFDCVYWEKNKRTLPEKRDFTHEHEHESNEDFEWQTQIYSYLGCINLF